MLNPQFFISKWVSGDEGGTPLSSPSGIAVSSTGSVFVTDSGSNRIHAFDKNGTFLRKWASVGTPSGIAVSKSCEVYVTGTFVGAGSFHVQVYSPEGVVLRGWGLTGRRAGRFSDYPSGIAINNTTGEVYIGDIFRKRVQVFDQNGVFIRKWGSRGTEVGNLGAVDNITIAPNGHERVNSTT
jgi:DNA-binding beta-propeller fold protein YncE